MAKANQVNWKTTDEDRQLINQIANRAIKDYAKHGVQLDKMTVTMDITACHLNGCPLDLKRLLSFDDFNFAHDISGISRHINRETGKIENFFLPRCHFTGSPRHE